jgi:hypothetical protein
VGVLGRGLAEVECKALARPVAGQREPAAAEVAGFGIDHREHERDRHRGIDRVAAAIEHRDAGAGGQRRIRHDEEALGVYDGNRQRQMPALGHRSREQRLRGARSVGH